MAKPVVFQDKEKIYYADSYEPLKAAARLGELYLWGWARGNYPGVQLPRNMLSQLRFIGVWDATRPQHWGWICTAIRALNSPIWHAERQPLR